MKTSKKNCKVIVVWNKPKIAKVTAIRHMKVGRGQIRSIRIILIVIYVGFQTCQVKEEGEDHNLAPKVVDLGQNQTTKEVVAVEAMTMMIRSSVIGFMSINTITRWDRYMLNITR